MSWDATERPPVSGGRRNAASGRVRSSSGWLWYRPFDVIPDRDLLCELDHATLPDVLAWEMASPLTGSAVDAERAFLIACRRVDWGAGGPTPRRDRRSRPRPTPG